MRNMMRQFSGMGLFGGGGIKNKMMNRIGQMMGMPDMSGMMGSGDFEGDDDFGGGMPQLPMSSSRKKLKKKKKKRRK
jgi:hypothetical protein